MDSIELNIELGIQDLLDYPLHLGRGKRIRLLILGLVLMAFAAGGFLFLEPEGPTKQGLGFCAAMGLFFLFMVWTEKSTYAKAAKQAMKTLDPETWMITPAGISCSTPGAREEVEWTRLRSILVLERIVVIQGKPQEAWVLPKRCISASNQLDQLLSWALQAGLKIERKDA